MDTIPALPDSLRKRLERIEPSIDSFGGMSIRYYPCTVRAYSGERLERVLIAEAAAYMQLWGIWPWDDRAKRYLPITKIADLEESPYRLPAALASALYRASESGMGYFSFVVVLGDGRHIPCVTGDAVDFACFPPDATSADVVDVYPDVRSAVATRIPAPGFYWSLYREAV